MGRDGTFALVYMNEALEGARAGTLALVIISDADCREEALDRSRGHGAAEDARYRSVLTII